MDQRVIQQLWDLAYHTFEKRPGDVFRTAFASKQAANEVQFRMMHSISSLKTAGDDELGRLCNDIRADVLVSEASGWMTTETSERMQDLLAPFIPVE